MALHPKLKQSDLVHLLHVDTDVEMLHKITQTVVNSNETLKQKIIYIAGFLVHKHGEPDTTQE